VGASDLVSLAPRGTSGERAGEGGFIADRLAGIAPKRYIPGTVKLGESSGRAGGFPVRLNVAWDIIAGRAAE